MIGNYSVTKIGYNLKSFPSNLDFEGQATYQEVRTNYRMVGRNYTGEPIYPSMPSLAIIGYVGFSTDMFNRLI